MGSVFGRPLNIEEISAEEWMRELPSVLPSFVARYLQAAWAAAGQLAIVTSTLGDLAGSRHETFLE
jgi:hypothetical protein